MKYAPANERGDKPYVVELNDWGRTRTKVVYAKNPTEARREAKGRGHVGLYVVSTRRATPEDLAP